MSEKKVRVMTEKRFATMKLSGRTTAEGFLQAHWDFLKGHSFLSPILDAYERADIYPTVTLQAIQSALMTHVLESEQRTQEAKLEARQEGGLVKKRKTKSEDEVDPSEVPNKSYTITLMCTVYDKDEIPSIQVGTVVKIVGYKIRTIKGDLVVKTREQAEGHPILETLRQVGPAVWDADDFGAAMRLADRRLFVREDSVYAVIRNNYGVPIETNVQRGDAIARMLRSKKGAVSRTRGRSTKTLGFQPHAKQSRVTGPWSHR